MNEQPEDFPPRHNRKRDTFPHFEFAIVLSCMVLALAAIVAIIISVS